MHRTRPRRLKHSLNFRSPSFDIFGEQFAMRSFGWELLIAALATTISAQDIAPPLVSAACPANISNTTYVRNQSCYEFKGVEENWLTARAYCHKRGGRLVSITDADLQQWLSSTAAQLWPDKNGVWIGLNDQTKGGVFMWDDYGTDAEHHMSYSSWASDYSVNGIFSGNCVQIRRQEEWKWVEKPCRSPGYNYNHICEYRARNAAALSVTVASHDGSAIASVAEVTLSVGSLTPEAEHWMATEYPLAVFSSSPNNSAKYGAGTITGKRGIALPLSLSLTAVVVIVALVAAGVVVWRHQQRHRFPKNCIVSWTRNDDDEGIMAGNPLYVDATQLYVDQATTTHGGGSDGLHERLDSNNDAEISSAVPVVVTLKGDAPVYCLADQDTSGAYEEPYTHEPSTTALAEPTPQEDQYAYIDTATLLKQQQQQPETFVGEEASTASKKSY